ncbi:MAG: DUF116 domain-containing protein [Sporomusaceae bacterium]|nr:DUF116 domain-containing protein [Sporomusaceae bacterium]
MFDAVARPKKRLFLALTLASLLLAGLSTYGIWKVSFPGLANISAYLPLILGGILAAIVVTITVGFAGIILAIIGLPAPGFFQGLAWSAINLLFPLAIMLGKLFDIDKERVERSFIEVSNHLVKSKQIRIKPEQLLVLSPHCIQLDTCPHKITQTVNNCKRCGACPVGELVALTEAKGVHLAIVNGGTLARQVVKRLRPKAVLAIACERDLTSGIQDTFPLPVVGVLNERPHGPCCNTRVSIQQVETAIDSFLLPAQPDIQEKR